MRVKEEKEKPKTNTTINEKVTKLSAFLNDSENNICTVVKISRLSCIFL